MLLIKRLEILQIQDMVHVVWPHTCWSEFDASCKWEETVARTFVAAECVGSIVAIPERSGSGDVLLELNLKNVGVGLAKVK